MMTLSSRGRGVWSLVVGPLKKYFFAVSLGTNGTIHQFIVNLNSELMTTNIDKISTIMLKDQFCSTMAFSCIIVV